MTIRPAVPVVLILTSLFVAAGCEILEEKIRDGKPPSSGGGSGSGPVGQPGTPVPPDAPVPPPKPTDPGPANCVVDADCTLAADYCTGCDCRVLGRGDKVPACSGPGVRCLVDPCRELVPFCSGGRCGVKSTRPVPPPSPPQSCTGSGEGSATTCRTTAEWKDRAYRACQAQNLQLVNYWPGESCGNDSYRYNKWECCGAVPPPPPSPPSLCTGGGEGSPTTCRTASEWKERAYNDCRANKLELVNYWPADSCGNDSYRYSKWECCGVVPPPTTPPPPTDPTTPTACFGGSDGGPTSCKSPDVWKTYASDLCAQKGAVLRDFGVDGECGGGNYRYMKFGCCSSSLPPSPAPEPPQKCSADRECPAIRIACKPCPEGGQTCPSSRCQAGACQIVWSACSGTTPGTPTPPAMPWDPCRGKKCGETCTLCPPWSSSCAETKDIKTCDIGGKCLSGPPSACR